MSGFLSNAASSVVKRLWSLKPTAKTGNRLPKSLRFSPVLALIFFSVFDLALLINEFARGGCFPAAASGSKSMVKYEGGYTVETVFDGSKLGIEPYSVEVTQGGELLVMDSMNSNIYRMTLPLSRCECAPSFPSRASPLNPACFGVTSPWGSANYMLS